MVLDFPKLEQKIFPFFKKAEEEQKRFFPYEYFYQLIRSGELKEFYQIDPKHSCVIAACEKNLPIFTP